MKHTILNPIKYSIGVIFLASMSLSASNMTSATNIIDTKCTACHSGSISKGISRISDQRKTPEGWFMTLSRMQSAHGLQITNEEKQKVVAYLANTQGLTPSETADYRYILEQRPNMQEKEHDSLFTEMCIRCHSAARVGLQRRTSDEWKKLVNFHLGHFPTIEYHALSRDREWFDIAENQIAPYLGEKFPLNKQLWTKWKEQNTSTKVEGSWTLYGHTLGEGDFSATMNVKKIKDQNYSIELDGKYFDGRPLKGMGKAILYSGYEFRATLDINGIQYNQVFAINNNEVNGRMFESIHPEEGSLITGILNSSSKSKILAISPSSIKAGSSQTITIVGNNLEGKITLPKNISLRKVIHKSKNKIVISVYASSKASTKVGTLSVGKDTVKSALTVYEKIDSIKVFPTYAIARVGDGGGKTAKQHSVFEAYGFTAGKDKKIGTKDDISLGKVNATWRVEPFDAAAKADKDVLFAGKMDALSGRFTPSFAGPNPKRNFSTNNAGNLKVIATYNDSKSSLESQSHLIVTIQRWVNPPIN